MDIYVVYNDNKTLERLGGTFKVSPFFHFIDDRTRKGRRDAWKVKNKFAAKLSPFAVVYEDDKPIKAFYTEADNDIVSSLIDYLNNGK